MPEWLANSLNILVALLLVILNGFFVAAEFALVKVRGSKLEQLVREGRPFARTARWLEQRLDSSLSACQLGITMASLALGWIAEPAFVRLLTPVLGWTGTAIHTIAFIIAFTMITSLHLVIGEQAPKIFAIRRPEVMILWCAAPMKFFYILFFPFLITLNAATSLLLKWVGVRGGAEHEQPHSEEEIRHLVRQAHTQGELSREENRLVQSVFEFDDLVCRQVMMPRADVETFDADQSLSDCLEIARRTKHTRYPVCEGSLDDVIGVIHVKDLVLLPPDKPTDLRSLMRPPHRVPETMPISRLLRHFQAVHQLMAFVVDEHGTVVGAVTLENVLEEIVGPVEDEFDTEQPEIVPDGPGQFIVHGGTSLDAVNRRLNLSLTAANVDTISGFLTAKMGEILTAGDRIELEGVIADVLETRGSRAIRIRLTLSDSPQKN